MAANHTVNFTALKAHVRECPSVTSLKIWLVEQLALQARDARQAATTALRMETRGHFVRQLELEIKRRKRQAKLPAL